MYEFMYAFMRIWNLILHSHARRTLCWQRGYTLINTTHIYMCTTLMSASRLLHFIWTQSLTKSLTAAQHIYTEPTHTVFGMHSRHALYACDAYLSGKCKNPCVPLCTMCALQYWRCAIWAWPPVSHRGSRSRQQSEYMVALSLSGLSGALAKPAACRVRERVRMLSWAR